MKGKSKSAGRRKQGKHKGLNLAEGRRQGGSEDEMTKKKKLYVFFWHDMGCEICYSLYAVDIPSTAPAAEVAVPERIWIDSVLRFRSGDWPRIMTCARLDSKLYFFGGSVGWTEFDVEHPREVYTLDLSSFSSDDLSLFRDEPMKILEKGPRMITGKVSPMISFVADGKIFVVSSRNCCPFTRNRLQQFEIFNPWKGKWEVGKDPCFDEALIDIGPYVIVNRKVIVLACSWKTRYIYSYDLDLGTWSEFNDSGWTKITCYRRFQFNSGSQFIGDAIYSMHYHAKTGLPVVIAIENLNKYYSEKKKDEEDFLLDEDKIFHVVKHKISSPGLSSSLICIRDKELCFLEVGAPKAPSGNRDHFNFKECFMSVTKFHVETGEGHSAEYLNCAHYAMFPDECPFMILSAHAV